MTHRPYKPFDPSLVSLQGSNLIEASAGTGKTYSIAILVLRLVVESQLSIKDILMVTFTKAAVAELEDRIRLFIRMAYKASLGKRIPDPNIEAIVQRSSVQETSAAERVRQSLREAVLFLDETSIRTIHSFCQQTLQEFAFETDQLFRAEMLPDIDPLIERAINNFWRRHITTLDRDLLERIIFPTLKPNMQQIVKDQLAGKQYLGYDRDGDYSLNTETQAAWLQQLMAIDEKEERLEKELHGFVLADVDRLIKVCSGNANAKRYVLPLLPDAGAFLAYVEKKRTSAYIGNLFPDILGKIDNWRLAAEEQKQTLHAIYQHLNGLAIREAGEHLRQYKLHHSILNYDDLIDHLHTALVKRKNSALEAALRKRYKAVFIDEFQDTDRQQYELFHRAFGQDTILFYIGDPKQSIYGWRKADIFTYFQARNAVQQVFGMNHNFRSSAGYIAAMNHFFLPSPGFDTFHFTGESDAIDYHPVESSADNTRGQLKRGTETEVPLSIRTLPGEDIAPSAAALVMTLLQNTMFSIGKPGQQRRIRPSDIGVLVRTGPQGAGIKAAMSRLGIPAVTVDDSKVLQSDEARWLLYLLEAIEEPSRASINRALLSPFTGYTIEDILLLDDETVLTEFGKYRTRWHSDGVYTALMDFVADFGVRHVQLQANLENGERIITNLMQLAEIVHQVESRKSLSMIELVSWLRRSMDGMAAEGDEYIQRVENDEDAVKIVTIHKSKGLEYPIVLAPYLEFSTANRYEFVAFRDPSTGDYVSCEKDRLTDKQLALQQRQAEQEHRRLLYVALTRAIYKTYIFQKDTRRASTLSVFTDALANSPSPYIEYESGPIEAPSRWFEHRNIPTETTSVRPVHFSLQEENWRRISYTFLAAKPSHTPIPPSPSASDQYDRFVFETLRRGGKTGELLHFLFENISFSDNKRWDKWIDEGLRRFAPGQRDHYLPHLWRLLSEVLNVRIRIGATSFTLSEIHRSRCITEFEFDFPVGRFLLSSLNSLSGPAFNVTTRDFRGWGDLPLEGVMNGRMDLFFEYDGRYYILDWKSNHLGSNVDDYSGDKLQEAMLEYNYHLQYLIYTVAAKKYLKSRLPGFDYDSQFGGVIYCFLRGARAGRENSVFSTRPPRKLVERLDALLGNKS